MDRRGWGQSGEGGDDHGGDKLILGDTHGNSSG
jgi:hypothetical protein